MSKYIFFLFFFSSIAFFSCVKGAAYTEVKVNDQYALTIPEYLQPCTDLHKKASLQLQNTDNDIYMMVIDEKKSDLRELGLNYNLKTYYSTIIKQPFLKNIDHLVIDKYPKEIKIAGNTAVMSTIKGVVNDHFVYYKLAIVETPGCFYQIVVWTRGDKKEKSENELQKIIESFREESVKKVS